MSFRWISAARNNGRRLAVLAAALLTAGHTHAQPAGEAADAVRYPYVAALARGTEADSVFFCGGALVAPRWIVTAAHCFFTRNGERIEAQELAAVVGRDRLDVLDKAATIRIDRIVPHPDYDPATQANDIALARLEIVAGPLIVPPAARWDEEPPVATVLGFGSFYEGRLAGNALSASGSPTAQTSYRLRQAEQRLLDPARCAASGGDRAGADGRICTAAPPADACVGDSGGPLVVRQPDGEDRLIGILSLGSGCAVPAPVAIYTRVADHAPWIMATVAGR